MKINVKNIWVFIRHIMMIYYWWNFTATLNFFNLSVWILHGVLYRRELDIRWTRTKY